MSALSGEQAHNIKTKGEFAMIEPYISFTGKAGEAMDFYEQVFGGTNKSVFKFGDMPPNPDRPIPENMKNWVGHGELTICGTTVNFGDMQQETASGDMLSLMLRFKTPEEVSEIYNKLIGGGQVLMEPAPQFYAKLHAWVRDKYGVGWQLICE